MAHRIAGISLVSLAAAGGLLLSGCATKEYVDEQVAAVSGRVAAVSDQVNALDGRVAALSQRVDEVDRTAQGAMRRADDATRLAQGKFIYSVIGQESVTFATNQWALSKATKTTLIAFADKLKSENRNVYVEIQGHGDPRGSRYSNRILGEKRALEVRRFLSSQGVPLIRMTTVSWGEERPTASGKSASANAANRRVVLTVVG